jgi:hypothetical protein
MNGWLFVAHSRYITTKPFSSSSSSSSLLTTTHTGGSGIHSIETALQKHQHHPLASGIREMIKIDPPKAYQQQQGMSFFQERIVGRTIDKDHTPTTSSNNSTENNINIRKASDSGAAAAESSVDAAKKKSAPAAAAAAAAAPRKRRRKRNKKQQEAAEILELPPPRRESLHENATFSACLLIRDDNDILPEWLAYHYHVIGLRHLIVAIDPLSSESPHAILQKWRKHLTQLEVLEWTDAHFMPSSFLKLHHPPSQYMQQRDDFDFNISDEALLEISNHRYRQRVFLAKVRNCLSLRRTLLRDTIVLAFESLFTLYQYNSISHIPPRACLCDFDL